LLTTRSGSPDPIEEVACFFNLPDTDFGAKDAAFVPFFGAPAAPGALARPQCLAPHSSRPRQALQ
jgi:lauroyl/myristoyl acyltransferase